MVKIVFFVSAFLPALATSSVADDAWIDGKWVARQPVTAGIYSEQGWETADLIRDRDVQIVGGRLSISNGMTCFIGAAVTETWRNDMKSFGSGGGNWSDIGLAPDGRKEYHVELRELDCGSAPPYNLIFQTDPFVLLLEFDGHVFVPLIRSVSS